MEAAECLLFPVTSQVIDPLAALLPETPELCLDKELMGRVPAVPCSLPLRATDCSSVNCNHTTSRVHLPTSLL